MELRVRNVPDYATREVRWIQQLGGGVLLLQVDLDDVVFVFCL